MGKFYLKMLNLFPSYRAITKNAGKIDRVNKKLDKIDRILCSINEKVDSIEFMTREHDFKYETLYYLSRQKENESYLDTKKRVVSSFPKAIGNVRKIQLAENYILSRLKDICDANDLDFFLDFGTLLGAVRHKGFIPWDDDVDVCMFEDEYEKLHEILKSDDQIVVNRYYQPWGGSLCKVKFRCNDDIFVDIFTLSYYECTDSVDELSLKLNTISGLYSETFRKESLPIFSELYDEYVRPVCDCRLEELSSSIVEKITENEDWINTGSYFSENIFNGHNNILLKGLLSTDEFFPILKDEIEFEGRKYSTFNNYQKYLAKLYGDFWNLPISIRPTHSDEVVVSEDSLEKLAKKYGFEI